MEDQNDIEKMFEGADDKLYERPPARAWDRLNAKLDKHAADKTEGKVVPIGRKPNSWLYIAAGLLLLVAMFTFVIRPLDEADQVYAMAEMPISLEDVPYNESDGAFYAMAVKYQKYYNTSPSMANHEERSNSRILLTERKSRSGNRDVISRSMSSASIPDSEVVSDETIADEVVKEEEKVEAEMAVEMSTAPAPADVMEMEVAQDVATYQASSELGAAEAMDELIVAEVYEKETDEVPMAKRKADYMAKKDQSRMARKAEKMLDASSNTRVYESDDFLELNDDVARFKWLIGQWSATNNNQIFKQEWKPVNSFTLEGRASFTINGEELEVQNMTILKEEDGLYLIIANLTDDHIKRFELKSIEAFEATFVNKLEANEEIIFLQLDQNNFSNISNVLKQSQSNLNISKMLNNNVNYSRVKQ